MKIDIREIDFDPTQMPVCPLCDNGIEESDPVVVINTVRGHAVGLAHAFCVDEHKP